MPPTDPSRDRLVLGGVHLSIGMAIFVSRYLLGFDVVVWLANEVATLPVIWLFPLGLAKGIYGLGAYIPGTTAILLFILSHDCSVGEAPIWISLVWMGVLLGLIVSFAVGKILQRGTEARPLRLHQLVFAVHPALAAIYFFELGYQRGSLRPSLLAFAAAGLLLLTLFVIGICRFKQHVSDLTNEIGPVWAAALVAVGLWRIVTGLRAGTGSR